MSADKLSVLEAAARDVEVVTNAYNEAVKNAWSLGLKTSSGWRCPMKGGYYFLSPPEFTHKILSPQVESAPSVPSRSEPMDALPERKGVPFLSLTLSCAALAVAVLALIVVMAQ